jgi:hypothetical protein
MDLSAVSSNSNNAIVEVFKQRRVAMQAMDPGLQSGEIKAAQQKLAAVQQDTPTIQPAAGTWDTQQNPWQSKLRTDLSSLTSGVQEGDIGTAQWTSQTLQEGSQEITAPGPNAAASNIADQASTPFLNDLMQLLNSVVSGVQSAATALQQDLQTVFGTAASGNTQATSASSASGPSQNAFINDLQALIAAAGSNNATGMQTAAKNLAQDIQGAMAGASSAFDAKTFFNRVDREGHGG